MQIAAVAYSKLTPQAKAKADALIKMNPDYPSWVPGVPDNKKAQYAFVHAAVWADDSKSGRKRPSEARWLQPAGFSFLRSETKPRREAGVCGGCEKADQNL